VSEYEAVLVFTSVHDERELLQAWRGGDDRAGSRLFQLHFDGVHRFFYGKVEDAAVEELTQETFLSIVRNRDTLSENRSVRAYLFTVARHKLYDYFRKRSREPQTADPSKCSLEHLGLTPTGEVARRQQEQTLLHALRCLPLELQILTELRYFEGMRGPELAESLDVPLGTVRSRLRRAHRLMREQLEQLALSPEQIRSTLSGLEDWAGDIRARSGEA